MQKNSVGDHCQALAALPPQKSRYPLCRRLGRSQDRAGKMRKISPTWIRSEEGPARSESLYRLHHPGPQEMIYRNLMEEVFIFPAR
jgi:hypothetical protein